MGKIFEIYDQFLGFFPARLHGGISIVLGILLVLGVYKVLKRQFIYIVLLAVLIPASVPILKNVWDQILMLLKFLVSRR